MLVKLVVSRYKTIVEPLLDIKIDDLNAFMAELKKFNKLIKNYIV